MTAGAVSDDGAFHPLETWDGDEVMKLFRERLRPASSSATRSRRISPGSSALFAEVRGMGGFDVMPDGREIVTAARVPDAGIVRQLQLVVKWSEELKRLAPAAPR